MTKWHAWCLAWAASIAFVGMVTGWAFAVQTFGVAGWAQVLLGAGIPLGVVFLVGGWMMTQ